MTILTLVVMAVLAAAPQNQDKAEVALKAAMDKEILDGNLKAAIEQYRKIAATYRGNRSVAARALLQLGQCHEKQGDTEARKAYDQLVREYGDQKEPVATARTRLAALGQAGGISHPSGITLRKVWAISGDLIGSPSPDGRYHSFVDWETGDLAVRDLATGQNRRLTNTATGRNYEEGAEYSVISGDGRQIAYAWHHKWQDYELRVIGMDGSNPRTVYRDKEFGDELEPLQWTADGKQILTALWRREPKEARIALIPAAGGPARILPTRAKSPWDPSLSPDGRFLVYGVRKADRRDSDLFLLSLDDGQEVPLVQSPAHDSKPVWTPDGKKVLFVSDRTGTWGFWTIDVVDGKPQGVPQLVKDGVTAVGGVIRPNGFTRQGAFYYSTNTSITDVYVTELDPVEGRMLRQPAPAAPRFVGSNSAPSWSPDGRRLAYYRGTYWNEPSTLVILSVETGEVRDIPVKLKQSPAPVIWHPDGRSVLVRTIRPDVLTNYWVDLQTGDHRIFRSFPMPPPGGGDISPDGKTLFHFTGGEPKLRGGVISCDIQTGQEREIARVPELAGGGFPVLKVSPDSKVLALRVTVDGNKWTAIRLAPVAGGEWRELCRFPKSETDGSWQIAWTPDGRNLLIVRRTGKDGMPELWRIPIAGGEPQRTGLSMEGMRPVSFHPDGRRIAFESGSRGNKTNELWVLENFLGAAESKAVSGAK